jgi:hypothetical protein
MFFAPAQRFPVIAEYFDGELIAFRSRDRDRAFAIFPFDRDLKTYRSIDRSIVTGSALTKSQFNIEIKGTGVRR